ncbi:efflux RND transporter periplasmic adaptor subunit [Paludibaculum fermentans]|uniref:Efflux RND transporter periplasmic adaptor subunit n=1 Tax=Paludibaculum fermentans TaxID=1473598 RepID=A0A7S7SJ95_PALFE|nr:efflux RND transporter periplasmic adaptor subunit [Paludibaculum fermentans]QOY86979.1 efflux RND transporter periplasmic adaptor subunit [Paludibaculum fermentans]
MSRAFSLALLLISILLAAGCGRKDPQAAKATTAPDPISIKTAPAVAQTVERAIMATGSLQPDETTTVSSEVPGRITKLNYDFGQMVKKGQILAELDTQELALQVERARGSLAQAMARVGIDPTKEEIPDTTPQTRQAKAQMEDAKSKYENAAKLVKTGDISTERFTELEKAYRARWAALEATQDELRTQLAAIRSLRADVKLAEKRLRDATVVAPFDGIVQMKHVSPGQYIKENVAIYTVVKATPLRLRAEIPESAVSEIHVGTTLEFTTEAVPNATFKAVVRELNPALDNRSRTLTAEARLLNGDARLKPGSFVQVRLVTNKAYPVIAVPKDAVYTVAGLNKFFSIENGKAVEHKIPQILGSNGMVEMPEGTIAAGAQVAVSNLPMLTNGAPVRTAGQN